MTEDLGAPISYLALERGTAVFASDGEKVGTVDEIRADEEKDIFDGLVVRHGLLGELQLVIADQVEEIHERGVRLNVDSAAFAELPGPD